ncbi:hypothetical protein ACULNC_13750 [Shigella flexneri]
MHARYPYIKQVGLRHSVQGTAEELARDLNIDPATLRYRCAGINHMAFYLELERKTADGSYVNLTRNCWRLMKQGRHRSQIFMVDSLPEYCALRNVQKAGLLRHGIVRTFCRIYAVVY